MANEERPDVKDIQIPEIGDLQVSGAELIARANALVVKDDESCIQGGAILLEFTRRLKSIDERMNEPISAANKLHKFLTGLRGVARAPLLTWQASTDQKIIAFRAEQRRKREDEEARERRQLEAQAEADRIAKAEAQMDSGDLKGCAKTLEAPAAPVVVRLKTPEPPKMQDISYRTIFKFRIKNANLIPMEHMKPNEESIGSLVDSLGLGAMAAIPGIEVWSEEVSIKRAGRAA